MREKINKRPLGLKELKRNNTRVLLQTSKQENSKRVQCDQITSNSGTRLVNCRSIDRSCGACELIQCVFCLGLGELPDIIGFFLESL